MVKNPLRRKAAPDDLFAARPAEVFAPRQATMAAQSGRLRRMRWLVWSAMVGVLLSGLGLVGVLGMVLRPAQDPVAPELFSMERTVATQELTRWLAGTPAPVPGGRLLTVDDTTDQPWALPKAVADQLDATGQSAPRTRVVHFTVADQSGRLYRCGVQVLVSGSGQATVVGTPSLSPLAVVDVAGGDDTPWPGMPADQVSEAAAKAIQGWAQAYAGGDPAALRLAVGDTDSTHWYEPLAGVSSVDVQPVAATHLDGDPSTQVVRVSLALTWAGQKADTAPAPTSMDVLVRRADTGAPRVVAWGDPGTGPALLDYANAVPADGREQSSSTSTTTPVPVTSTGPGTTPAATPSTPAATPAKRR